MSAEFLIKIDKIKTVGLYKYQRGYTGIGEAIQISAGYWKIGEVIQISAGYWKNRRGYANIGKNRQKSAGPY